MKTHTTISAKKLQASVLLAFLFTSTNTQNIRFTVNPLAKGCVGEWYMEGEHLKVKVQAVFGERGRDFDAKDTKPSVTLSGENEAEVTLFGITENGGVEAANLEESGTVYFCAYNHEPTPITVKLDVEMGSTLRNPNSFIKKDESDDFLKGMDYIYLKSKRLTIEMEDTEKAKRNKIKIIDSNGKKIVTYSLIFVVLQAGVSFLQMKIVQRLIENKKTL